MARSPAESSAPRISVNDLALFMVSSDTARLAIVRRSKARPKPPIIRYKDARPPIVAYLSDANRRVNPLVAAEEMFAQRASDSAASSLLQDDARQSIEVLRAVQRMANVLGPYDFVAGPRTQPKLNLVGVEVSVRADLIAHGSSKGKEAAGAAVLRMTQDDSATDAARSRRREMGLYVATLARLHMDRARLTNREIVNRLCMSIDVQHGEVFTAPDSNTRRMSDLESACRFIAAMWPAV